MTKIAFAQNYETSFTFQHQPKKNAKTQKQFKKSKSKNNLKTQAQKSKNNLKIKPKTHKNINFRISKPYPLSF